MAISVVMVVAAVIASFMPAQRATQLDPALAAPIGVIVGAFAERFSFLMGAQQLVSCNRYFRR